MRAFFAAASLAAIVAVSAARPNQLGANATRLSGTDPTTAWQPSLAWNTYVSPTNGQTYGTCATSTTLYAATVLLLHRFDLATGAAPATGANAFWLNNSAQPYATVSRPVCAGATSNLPDTVFIAVGNAVIRFDAGKPVWTVHLHTSTQGDIALLDSQQHVYVSTVDGHTNALRYADGGVALTFMGNWLGSQESNPVAFDGKNAESMVVVNSASGTFGLLAGTGQLQWALPFAPGQTSRGRPAADVDGVFATGRIVLQTAPPLSSLGDSYTLNVSVLAASSGELIGGFTFTVDGPSGNDDGTAKKAKHPVAANGVAYLTTGSAHVAVDLATLVPLWENDAVGGHSPALHMGLDYRIQPVQSDQTPSKSPVVLVQASTGFRRWGHEAFQAFPPRSAFGNCTHVDHYPTVVGNTTYIFGRKGCLAAVTLAPPEEVVMKRCAGTSPMCSSGCSDHSRPLICTAVDGPGNTTVFPSRLWELRWCVSPTQMRIERRAGPTCALGTSKWYTEYAGQCEILESGQSQLMSQCGNA